MRLCRGLANTEVDAHSQLLDGSTMVAQAFATVEVGQSPQIWFAALKEIMLRYAVGCEAKHCTEDSLLLASCGRHV